MFDKILEIGQKIVMLLGITFTVGIMFNCCLFMFNTEYRTNVIESVENFGRKIIQYELHDTTVNKSKENNWEK